jgi:hypothetical protein
VAIRAENHLLSFGFALLESGMVILLFITILVLLLAFLMPMIFLIPLVVMGGPV